MIMNKIMEEIDLLEADSNQITVELTQLHKRQQELHANKDVIQKALYEKNFVLIQVKEIYRLAAIQFSRLRDKANSPNLTDPDIQELEKWIGRAKTQEGLMDILNAITELTKYKPSEVRNIYALVQKIIIGGAYHKK